MAISNILFQFVRAAVQEQQQRIQQQQQATTQVMDTIKSYVPMVQASRHRPNRATPSPAIPAAGQAGESRRGRARRH